MQAATRAAVKKKLGRKRYAVSKIIPQHPQSIEREYARTANAYMKVLNNAIAAGIPKIKALLNGVHTDADEPEEERRGGKPSQQEIEEFNREVDRIIAEMLKEFQFDQGIFDLYGQLKRLAKQTQKLSIAEWKRVVKRTLGIDLLGDYYNGPKFQELADKWVSENVGLIKTIPQETLGKMREAVTSGFMSGAANKTIAAQIQEAYNLSKSHAKFIARDQAAKLNAKITRQQQEDAGVTEYIWRTTGDGRVRESHRNLNNKRFKYSDPPVVDPKTGRRENPGGDYQCRCVGLPVFDIDTVVLPWEHDAAGAAKKEGRA
jgi:SPP1 gp7 family putative phage head morphogenesis protein